MISQFDEALSHYRSYVNKERLRQKREMADILKADKGSSNNNEKKSSATSAQDNKYEKKKSSVPASHKFAALSPRRKYEIQRHLTHIPQYSSYFISTISLAQMIIFVTMFSLAYQKSQIAPFKIASQNTVCTGTNCPVTFDCDSCRDTTAITKEATNPFYGPYLSILLQWGARFTPCMRRDSNVYTALAKVRQNECGVFQNNTCEADPHDGISCCTLVNFRAGMTNESYCLSLGGNWTYPNALCDTTANIVLRPCCTGFTGTCKLLTEEQCLFENGNYSMYLQLCSQVDCLAANCKLITGLSLATDTAFGNQPLKPNQFWRMFTSILTHSGLIQMLFAVGFQYYIGVGIERRIGWVRMLIIYVGASIGGLMVSSIFVPYEVTNGSDTPVFALLAILFVEVG